MKTASRLVLPCRVCEAEDWARSGSSSGLVGIDVDPLGA